MKAAVLHEPHQPMEITDVATRSPGPREVLIATAYAGLCHSDLHFIEGLFPHPLPAVLELTGGGVHHAIECLGMNTTAEQAFNMLALGGTATIVGMIPADQKISVDGMQLLRGRTLKGSSMGSNRFRIDMPRLVELYLQGRLHLDEWVSAVITLDQINDGFADMRAGRVVRSVIKFD